jgi:transmembrane sensor
MMSTKDEVRIAAAGQAAEWFIANQEPAPDYKQCAAFIAWLKASPIHIEEYLGVALVARDLRTVANGDSDQDVEALLKEARADISDRVAIIHPPAARVSRPQYSSRSRRWSIAAAAAAAATAFAWWMGTELAHPEARRYETQRGQQTLQRLADGSILYLNIDTAVEVVFDRRGRNLRLETGEAYFVVAHDASRKFQVMAGDAEIVAVGTRFNVRLQDASTIVTVVEGTVEVGTAAASRTLRIPAGYQARIDGGVLPAQSEAVDTEATVAWLQHKIAFKSRPLGEVADEFNRYAAVRFIIEDEELRALRVSGVFNAYDSNSFAAFLESLDDVRIERTGGEIRVLRKDIRQPGEGRPTN